MLIEVSVKTGSKKGPLIETQQDGSLVIYLHSRPHDGEANAELIKLLSKHFHTAKTNIAIKSGVKSHHKKIEITSFSKS